jgi:hypothetical protein
VDKLEPWLANYQLPEPGHPLHPVERANLGLLRSFFGLLALTTPASDPLQAVRVHLPDFPDFPLRGAPSGALHILGLGRAQGPLLELSRQLRQTLSAEQARDYLLAIEED